MNVKKQLAFLHILIGNLLLVFLTYTKKSEAETFFSNSNYYDVEQARISQEKHQLMGFPLSYQISGFSQ